MTKTVKALLAALAIAWALPAQAQQAQSKDDTFSPEEIAIAAANFFGGASEGLASVIEKAFGELGRPNAYIAGEEVSGAFVFGVRYGKGQLTQKAGPGGKVYWQGPSVGFDFGGNAAKVFTLVYNLDNADRLYQRVPGVDGSFYFVAGVGMNYQRGDGVTLAPIRTGVGVRAGANVGYLHYTREASPIPF